MDDAMNPRAATSAFHIRRTARLRWPSGFTLIEMLTVVVVLALLVALAAGTLPKSLTSQRLSGAARQFAADLTFATQVARRDNKAVVLRIYQITDSSQPASTPQWRAYQLAQITGWQADGTPTLAYLTELQRLPDGIIISPSTAHTSLAADSRHIKDAGAHDPDLGQPYRYLFFHISPNGKTSLPGSSATTFTLTAESPGLEDDALPPDFRTITLDPATGAVVLF